MTTLTAAALTRRLLTCGLLGTAGVAPAAELALDFDFAQAHDFLGFGTQVWVKGDRGGGDAAGAKLGPKARARLAEQATEADADVAGTQLLKELNARFVRVSMIPKLPFNQLRPGMSVEQVLDLLEKNDSPAQRERIAAFNKRLQALNIQPVLIFWRMPDPWVERANRRAGSKQQATFAKTEHLGDLANLLTAQMLWLQRQGVRAAAVELTNEPHGAWDTLYKREQYAQLLLKTRGAMDKAGLQAWPIAGPGTGIPNFDHYIGAIVEAGATKAMGYASVHVYLKPEVLADAKSPGMASFVGRGKFGPVLVTEFGVKQHVEDDPRSDDNLETGSPEFAVQAASTAVMLLAQGAGGLIYWQLQDFGWQKKQHGLMAENGERRPVAYAMKALFGGVPAGAKVVGARSLRADLPAVALQAGGKPYLMLVNRSAQAQAVTARLAGAQACSGIARIDAWSPGSADAKVVVRGASAQAAGGTCTVKAELQAGAVAVVAVQ